MKRSGFKRPTYPQLLEKRKAKALKPRVKKKRSKLPSLKSLQTKCDGLLTPICKKQSPFCESCGKETEVGHHWIEKSRSNYLRYELANLIPLCHSCHAKIHNRFGNSVVGGLDVAEIIIRKRGREWKEHLGTVFKTYVKVDRFWYMEHYERLSKILNSI